MRSWALVCGVKVMAEVSKSRSVSSNVIWIVLEDWSGWNVNV